MLSDEPIRSAPGLALHLPMHVLNDHALLDFLRQIIERLGSFLRVADLDAARDLQKLRCWRTAVLRRFMDGLMALMISLLTVSRLEGLGFTYQSLRLFEASLRRAGYLIPLDQLIQGNESLAAVDDDFDALLPGGLLALRLLLLRFALGLEIRSSFGYLPLFLVAQFAVTLGDLGALGIPMSSGRTWGCSCCSWLLADPCSAAATAGASSPPSSMSAGSGTMSGCGLAFPSVFALMVDALSFPLFTTLVIFFVGLPGARVLRRVPQ
jgi:hypothetical protein